MTNREFFVAIANTADLSADLTQFATEQIAKMDAKNANHSSKQAEKSASENAPLFEKIREVLSQHPDGMISSEVAAATGLSTSKVSALGRKMVERGIITTEKVKIPKVGERVKFTLA